MGQMRWTALFMWKLEPACDTLSCFISLSLVMSFLPEVVWSYHCIELFSPAHVERGRYSPLRIVDHRQVGDSEAPPSCAWPTVTTREFWPYNMLLCFFLKKSYAKAYAYLLQYIYIYIVSYGKLLIYYVCNRPSTIWTCLDGWGKFLPQGAKDKCFTPPICS
jgi:hypothetical protein